MVAPVDNGDFNDCNTTESQEEMKLQFIIVFRGQLLSNIIVTAPPPNGLQQFKKAAHRHALKGKIFRRKKKVHRSFASLFSIDSSSSWLNSSLFSGTECPLAESSWIDGGSDFDSSFSNNQGGNNADLTSTGRSWLSEENLPLIDTEACTKESLLINKSTGGFFELPFHSSLHPTKCSLNNMSRGPDFMTVKNFFFHLIILVLSICVAVFARCFLGGAVAALLMTMLVFAAVLHTAKSAYPCFIKSHNILDHVQSENLKNNYIRTAS
ncbi:transmembrane protein 71-like [Chiloscyllium plagiosum]|uniref:transmembrane protein 71-like n=1 Tax=Chiloscyllium plagiosum TaxID=36176 RepID=UPI001CB8722C|nr:transmembrane protein 71-like [Chiloscyllium plagiosum]